MGTNKVDKPLVSIRLMTFNHSLYIKEAMGGIMAQQTNFPFEVVIGDDFSKDGTLDIIRLYKDTENIKIRILNRQVGDQYWTKRQESGRLYNFKNILENCLGKYIATCDGDDYWTDPLKLQKQVDFLEQNQEFGLVHTDCDFLYESTLKVKKNINKTSKNIIPTNRVFDQLLVRNTIRTVTVLFRAKFKEEFHISSGFRMGDYPLWLEISKKAKIGYLEDSTAIYRVSNNSASNFPNIKLHYKFQLEIYKIKFYFVKKYGCKKETNDKINENFSKLKLHIAYLDINSHDASIYYLNLKNNKLATFENFLEYLGSFSSISYSLVNFIFRVNNKISALTK